ncbi:transglutaminase family protein [Roseibium alexandrii]|uniref:Transglutaminase-like enzyme, putative cysteine protease n=1 Tax=Roseibium alexandrii (strain DSM 17067 / NCIMB 14079 / DFL-11) TaxID=244592 RepID=A0A5E8H6G0_ROSAD|nr:transglutaminase family protein [Roseibium alexandrii]EEE47580.1 Transglutaminase-like enzyme, putative cysteine protease [Roseibium alexandrii DFL-11]
MRYEIRLTVGYDYGAPSEHARTLVRLLPSDVAGKQIVPSRLLTVGPKPQERHDTRDFFGNVMTVLVFHEPIDKIEVSLKATVERLQPAASLDFSPDLQKLEQEVLANRNLTAVAPAHYTGISPRVPADPAITEFAKSQAGKGLSTMSIVESIGKALHEQMRFDPEATEVSTPPAEAYSKRHGVCQDFSHIMISGLRSLGIPAGYVSGFLRTLPPKGQPRLEGADAMHAWVCAWCGIETGWIEYDPTNACIAGSDHIVVAYGRDYSDVAPVKGVLRSSGDQSSFHSVDVRPL